MESRSRNPEEVNTILQAGAVKIKGFCIHGLHFPQGSPGKITEADPVSGRLTRRQLNCQICFKRVGIGKQELFLRKNCISLLPAIDAHGSSARSPGATAGIGNNNLIRTGCFGCVTC